MFEFFNKIKEIKKNNVIPNDQYYQKESYYQDVTFKNTPFETEHLEFTDKVKGSIPSKNGLYVPEILLLEYCTYGKYPNPKNGYPGFWWFEYGIKNVDYFLESLCKRGFIILNENGKYDLTEKGQMELNDNLYVPYMHKNKKDKTFTVWDVNRELVGKYETYKEYIEKKHEQIDQENKENYKKSMELMKEYYPEGYEKINKQDKQLEYLKECEEKYAEDQDKLIEVYEKIWNNEGILFEGNRWNYRIIELYFDNKMYDKVEPMLELIAAKKIKMDNANMNLYYSKNDYFKEKLHKKK